MVIKIGPLFSFRSLKVLPAVFMSLFHLELTFCVWCEVGIQFHLFHIDTQLLRHHLLTVPPFPSDVQFHLCHVCTFSSNKIHKVAV